MISAIRSAREEGISGREAISSTLACVSRASQPDLAIANIDYSLSSQTQKTLSVTESIEARLAIQPSLQAILFC